VPDEHENPADRPADDAEENDRPTVNPPFDPAAFARDVLNSAPPSCATPPAGMDQSTFRPAAPAAPPREATPTAMPPAELTPKAGPVGFESVGRLGVAIEQEWAALELATRPPPGTPSVEAVRIEPAPAPRLPSLDDLDAPIESAAETVRRPSSGRAAEEAMASAPAEATAPPKPRSREMNDLVELGDYSGALEIAEEILRGKPDDLSARMVAETCRTVLRQMYATRIGPLDRVPVVMVPRDQLRWLSIDHKAGFVLSLVDGVSSLEMIIDVSGMPELDTLRILSELAQQRIISLR
jgi:hypothetical protein